MPVNLPVLTHLAELWEVRRIFRSVLLVASLVLLLTHLSTAQDSTKPKIPGAGTRILEPVKQIGVGWRIGKPGWMSFVSFSPDGTMVASDGASTPDDVSPNLTLWSFPEGRLIKRIPVRPTALSSDWKYYASYNGVGEVQSGKGLISLGEGVFALHAFSPDSRYVAESLPGRIHDPHIRIVELASGRVVSAFGEHTAFSLSISPDGKTLAAGYWNVVTLWDMLSGERLAVLRGFGRYVQGLSFSHDRRYLAAGTDFGGLQIWDVHRQMRIHSLHIEEGQVSDPQFSPDGRFVAVGVYGTGAVWLVDTRTGKILDHEKVSDMGCGSVAFSPDGHFLIVPSTGGLIKWPYDHGGTIRVFKINAR